MIRISRIPASINVVKRVVNHRLVVDRQQLLADRLGDRPEPTAGAAGKDNALHWAAFSSSAKTRDSDSPPIRLLDAQRLAGSGCNRASNSAGGCRRRIVVDWRSAPDDGLGPRAAARISPRQSHASSYSALQQNDKCPSVKARVGGRRRPSRRSHRRCRAPRSGRRADRRRCATPGVHGRAAAWS